MENYSYPGGDSTSILIDDGTAEELRNTITKNLLGDSPLPAHCCIFRVPELIRRQKKAAYEPDIVSIGPFHRGCGEKFQLMEKVKRWYLQCLLLSCTDISLDSLIKGIMELGRRARDCYADPLEHLSQKDFVQMMILDGCFLLELFRKELWDDLQDENDPVFNLSCMLEYLYHDLLLLENQLPWFVLERLYNLTANNTNQTSASLTKLVLNFFKQSVFDDRISDLNLNLPFEILHILDLIRTVTVVPFKNLESQKKEERVEEQEERENEPELPQRIPNATTLSEAGVQFRRSKNTPDCIMNIEFDFKNGVFTIPPLGIDEKTGPLFRNLIAFEQCHHSRLHKITSYAVLMDNLIDTNKDVELLRERGILANWLSPEDAAQFFNELYNDTTVIGFYYRGLCNDVNKYYNTDWNKWMEKLKRDYFSTPWAVISFIAAFILLVLTLVQTAYTIHPING
ncbi:PREDICTED: UPF0481 [Prunus dulcis]|uniref:PREDICTED: UPF0481 n=1 Tax=Prunus dulcis TaxID=3755 RepID=A0A5E4FFY2_PRUDU|nr:UPF0481 protein At3g47200-like [Prunus dulcis]KAI5341378.1 hypothetical protein L3X38_020652 [Prunus dulcis]VVA26762.1 PREDICTED: UPF0481 [Prunus dulcis]